MTGASTTLGLMVDDIATHLDLLRADDVTGCRIYKWLILNDWNQYALVYLTGFSRFHRGLS